MKFLVLFIVSAFCSTVCCADSLPDPLPLTFVKPPNPSIVKMDGEQIESLTLTSGDLPPPLKLAESIGNEYTVALWVKVEDSPALYERTFSQVSPVTILDFYPLHRKEIPQEFIIRIIGGELSATSLNHEFDQWKRLDGDRPEIIPGEWYFLAYTHSAERGIFYINGKEMARTIENPPAQNDLQVMTLGHFLNCREMTGTIYQPRVYKEALKPEQIQEIFEARSEENSPVGEGGVGGPVRALAPNYVVVDESPDPQNIPLYTPSILRLPSGRLIAANERSGKWKKEGKPGARISTSDDGGLTWTLRGSGNITHGRLFQAGNAVYYLGHEDDLMIMRSDDEGETWGEPKALTEGQVWHQTAANVWYTKGNVYLVMERLTGEEGGFWSRLAPVLMRARESDDLTKRESWTLASELPFIDVLPGFRENKMPTDFFGIPFFPQTHPDTNVLARKPLRQMHPMGWLEANVVQFQDPNHYWYDPSGKTFHLFMRAHTGSTGYAALAKVTENDDGTMTTSLEKTPSGTSILFLPFPGGQMRFHILYDEKTKLYWMLGTQATDSMSRIETLPPNRFGLPSGQRQRMVLYFSRNMVDWCFAGLVDKVAGNKESRHYAAMDFDGDDLVILARSGNERAKTAHNGNLVTFHRIKDFRNLVY